ncbi:TonB-dependent receptor [Cellulophaga sp. BC115SP]|uniref:SusC/RagA family TonB-linked outer membrane protein n=1 Tax=Cellulophaga sp. BC115SP TaxID=2683263 RepID=UPI00141306F2|nr:TonB-dependent receptor [Cellulophaga sp. BC115SP]NBB31005.1 SusC/RagA family TonB-linked outer membrane protein [Cellulophaga sp. BC115SP]
MRKSLWYSVLTILCTLSSIFAYAQDKLITGRVTDASEEALPGVSISVKNKKAATISDAKGEYKIKASIGDILVFSSVGYVKVEKSVSAVTTLNISLVADNTSLEEVVVVGYGTSRKKDLTGSVTSITSKDFQTGAITTPEQLISGKVPGVSIISNSGQPGAGSTIRIRGGSSLSASNNPLIVIDGVPLEGEGGIAGASNPLSFINPNDIETFTVLKDASAAAIYGTRASNGVIIITTKKGKNGALRINFSSVNSLSTVAKQVSVLSADQFRTIVNEKGTAAQKALLGTANTNWQDVIYQTAHMTDNNLSIGGEVAKLPYRISLGFQTQSGVLKTDKLQRTSVALSLNPTFFNNHLKVDLSLKGSLQKSRFANLGAIGAAVSFDPTQPVYATVNPQRFGGYFEWLDRNSPTGLMNLAGRNPLGMLEQRYDEGTPQRSIGNIQFDYKFHFLPELRANLNLGYDVSKGEGTVYVSDSSAIGYVVGGKGGTNNIYKQTKQNTLLEFYLNYVKDLRFLKSRVDVMAGYSYNNYLTTNYNYASYTASGEKYPNTDPAFPFDKPENTLISFFGRANYSVNNRYFLTATLRRDGSSRFTPANRWGLFPSIALAWDLKEEGIFAKNETLSTLKLRASYGVTGQQDGIGNYDYYSYYALSAPNAAYQFGNSYYQGYRPGGFYANRKWEETASTNLAIDYGFWDGRVKGSVDFYVKKTKDLLNNIPQPAGANFSAYIVANVGSMENRGVEFSVSTQIIRKRELTWNLDFNATYNENKITNLTVVPGDQNYVGFPSGGIAGGIGGQFAFINSVGYSRNTFYLYKQVYDANGKPLDGVFVDQNGDGVINQDDLYRGKSSVPKVFFGLSSSLNYKRWNLGVVMRSSVGNYVYNNNYSQSGVQNQILGNNVLYNASTNYLTTGFKGNSQQLLSDYYIQNASFVRMDNANLSYDLGKIMKNSNVNLRLNASVQNVFVITKYTGLDPEVASGIDSNLYPRPRTFSLGLNFDF